MGVTAKVFVFKRTRFFPISLTSIHSWKTIVGRLQTQGMTITTIDHPEFSCPFYQIHSDRPWESYHDPNDPNQQLDLEKLLRDHVLEGSRVLLEEVWLTPSMDLEVRLGLLINLTTGHTRAEKILHVPQHAEGETAWRIDQWALALGTPESLLYGQIGVQGLGRQVTLTKGRRLPLTQELAQEHFRQGFFLHKLEEARRFRDD